MDDATSAFLEAARTFAELLQRDEVAARWDEPSTMEGYTVGDLAGHVTAATAPLESALDMPPPSDRKVIRLGRYYAGMRIGTPEDADKPIHGAMHDLSHVAGREGAEANADRFRSLVERLGKQLAGEEADRLLDLRPVVPIAIRLDDFVRTRVRRDQVALRGIQSGPFASPSEQFVALATQRLLPPSQFWPPTRR